MSSSGPETHAKPLALSYDFDLLGVFLGVSNMLLLLFVPKVHREGCRGPWILVRVPERFSPVKSLYSRFKRPVSASFVFGSHDP